MSSIWLVILGLTLLLAGGELLVRSAAAVGIRLGLTPVVAGLTIVAFGTSTPELLVSLQASFAGSGGIALGNVVGSNIANILLVLGLAALVRPLKVQAGLLRTDVPVMIAASALLLVLLSDGGLGRMDGLVLCAGILIYTTLTVVRARREQSAVLAAELDAELPRGRPPLAAQVLLLALALVVLVLGARWLVQGAVALARGAGVPEAVVGLTLVAVGTSLPELATSLIAAARRHGDIAVGNLVGSNIFNILAILGVVSVLGPIARGGVMAADLWTLAGVALLALPLMRTGFVVSRREGAFLVALYAGYLYLLSGRAA